MAPKRKAGCESDEDIPSINRHGKKICDMQVSNPERLHLPQVIGSTDFEKAEA